MIHPESVKAWEAESKTFRDIIIKQREEMAQLHIANDALGRRINDLEGEIERLREALKTYTDLDMDAAQREIERLRDELAAERQAHEATIKHTERGVPRWERGGT